MKGTWLVAGALTLLVAVPAVSEAQYRRDDRGYRQTRAADAGWERGFDEGLKDGARDGKRGERMNVRGSRDYREGDKGYRSSYGNKRAYVSSFRAGYEEGYRRSYDGFRRNGRNGRYEDRARRRDRGYDDRYGRDGNGRGEVIYEEPAGRW